MNTRDGAGTVDDPYYPDVVVVLTGNDSNAGAIMGAVTVALKQHFRDNDLGSSSDECDAFRMEAMSGDYDNLLQTCMKWVSVE